MPAPPRLVEPPPGSRILSRLAGADFVDAWSVVAARPEPTALAHFMRAARATPRWVDVCMTVRNRLVAPLGLKDLGTLTPPRDGREASDYGPGDRVGIFTVFENRPDEALIGDRDKHLDVLLSVHRKRMPATGDEILTVTTVVHVHNLLGRLYMLPVRPMHRLIAPATLRTIGR